MTNINNQKIESKPKKHESKPHYTVENEELLYIIAEAGLLDKLHGVNMRNNVKAYFFDQDIEIKAIIDKYTAAKKLV